MNKSKIFKFNNIASNNISNITDVLKLEKLENLNYILLADYGDRKESVKFYLKIGILKKIY